VDQPDSASRLAEGVGRIEDVVAGSTEGLTEAQFRDALK
jgi:hypothetical protein